MQTRHNFAKLWSENFSNETEEEVVVFLCDDDEDDTMTHTHHDPMQTRVPWDSRSERLRDDQAVGMLAVQYVEPALGVRGI